MQSIDLDVVFEEGTLAEAMAEGPLAGLEWELLAEHGPSGWPLVRVQVPAERWAEVAEEWDLG
jgi:hypothetical protein